MSLNLIFRAEAGDFEGKATYCGKEYEIILLDFNINDIESATGLATKVCNWLDKNLEDVKRFTAKELIPLKNNTWLGENEPLADENVFMKIIELDNVLIFSDGGFEIFFIDNDLFWGHWIKVDIDHDFNISSADIVG